MKRFRFLAAAAVLAAGIFQFGVSGSTRAQLPDPCLSPGANPIACENTLPGAPAAEWDVAGAGDPLIQGFATDISVNRGGTVRFKIATPASSYRLDIYRLGFYGGAGARKVASVLPHATLPQDQPACIADAATGLVDCGNWAESASWDVPATAVSGVYLAKLVRTDGTAGASHVVFVVRDDTGQSALLFQTSDTTWQAYNRYGGNSLYSGAPAGRAYKVSYNRPFTTREYSPEDWLFNAEYPMIRWLEANGYNVSYTTGVDVDRRGTELLEHRVFLSVGHDEYWSGAQRAAVEAARDAGVNLAFFSGNEIFWKTRWETSIDGSGAAHRTLVCYKETHANAKIDPSAEWTGTWRDPRFSPPADGGNPENALTGTLFTVNDGATTSIDVPAAYAKFRLWRHTTIAALTPGQSATLAPGTLGYEWDEAPATGQPAGLVRLSRTVRQVPSKLTDFGSNYAAGLATHSLTLYRAGEALVFGAGTVQWSWGLDAMHDRTASTADLRMQQATVNLLADMGVQPATPAADLVISAAATDALPPVSIITAPAAGTNLPVGTIASISGTASDVDGVVAAVEVSTDGGATWQLATGTTTWTLPWTPTATGPALVLSRAIDDSGRVETPAPGVAVQVTTSTSSACPCTLWPDTATPEVTDSGPDNAVELGVKFSAAVDGYVTGVRFYKGAGATGTHTGSLWAIDGTRLARLTFLNETASGWQTAFFDVPVPIRAGTTYVASYYTPNGHYAFNRQFFQSSGVTSGPLTAPATTVTPNGVFRYGTSSMFPEFTYNAGNYWVDVVFATTWVDTVAPAVLSTTPPDGSQAVDAAVHPSAVLSESLAPESIVDGVFEVRGLDGAPVAGAVAFDSSTRRLSFTPAQPLAYSSAFTARIHGGSSTPRIMDRSGNGLTADVVWSFTTAGPPPPPPHEGPGGPVLVVGSPANPFSRYYAEILRAEGLNLFTVTDLSSLSAETLARYDVIVLGEVPLAAADVVLLTGYVQEGGQLIAMRPDAQLASLLGIARSPGTLSEGYLLLDSASAAARGLVDETMQFHGTADLYTVHDARTLATLFADASTATVHPAVTLRQVGGNGGQAAAFAYDLARSVVYTRQGNPAWSGQERDGTAPIRSDDLFFGGTGTDWVNLDKVQIPQADEQMRLLANLIIQMGAARKPLPRFWYFPRATRAVVVMTGDDHGLGGTAGRFERYLAASTPGCSLEDWECIRATSYLYPSTPLASATAAAYQALGFEVGLHVTTSCSNFSPSSLRLNYAGQLAAWLAAQPGLAAPATNRTHCIAWSDYDTQPQVELENGIRLDTNYYYWPGSWLQDRPGLFTGSGLPMRFARVDGTMIDVYQATTQLTDESNLTYTLHIDTLLDNALGDKGYYGAFTANMHTDTSASSGSDIIVAAAQARGVPVISARQLLTWLDGRNASSFADVAWDGGRLTFRISVGAGARGLRAMLPATSRSGALMSLTADGQPVTFTQETIKGIDYVTFPAAAASYVASYVSAAPPETTIIAAPSGIVTTTDATVEFTSSDAGTFECVLDGLPYAPCASPAALSNLAQGDHTFAVRAVTVAGLGDPTPAIATWTVDSVPPDTTMTSAPSGLTAQTTATLQFSATRAASLECSFDGAPFAACASPVSLTGLSQGVHTFAVRAVAASGLVDPTPAIATWTVNSLPPETTLTAAPSGTVTATVASIAFTGTGGSTFHCSLDGGAFAACASPVSLTGLAQGAHTFAVRAVSVTGVIDPTPATAAWTVNSLPPDTTIASAPSGVVKSTSATVQFSSAQAGTTFQCRLDSAPFAACSSPALLANLGQGAHTFAVRGVSASGVVDPTPATATWTVDTVAPVLTSLSVTTTLTSATIAWTTSEPSDTVVDYGTSATTLTLRASHATAVTSHSITITGLVSGRTYYYRVSSRDAVALVGALPSATGASTFTTRSVVTKAPAAVVREYGTLRAGTVTRLSANDNAFYEVNSTTSGYRATSWYGSFTGVSTALTNLKVTYSGRNSRSVVQSVAVWRWTTSEWVTLDTRAVSTTELLLSDLVPAGTASAYVSSGGELRVRVGTLNLSGTSYYTSGDYLRITYERP